MATDLAPAICTLEARDLLYDEKEKEMLSRLLPEPSPPPEVEQIHSDEGPDEGIQVQKLLPKKRVFSPIDEFLSSQRRVPHPLKLRSRKRELLGHRDMSKKQALFTRKKMSAGLHEHRGLSKMMSSSTNALERTKKMEILQCAGYVFVKNKKLQGTILFC